VFPRRRQLLTIDEVEASPLHTPEFVFVDGWASGEKGDTLLPRRSGVWLKGDFSAYSPRLLYSYEVFASGFEFYYRIPKWGWLLY
jgi:hypothetical protein